MKAVLFAAGRGVRMGIDFPKVLLELDGRSLLEWHAQRLAEAGVRELFIVTGYERCRIAKRLPALADRYGLSITEIINSDFAEGSVLSFAAALPVFSAADEPVILMDADVVYGRSFLPRLLASPHPTSLLIDHNFSLIDDDPVLVPLRDGRPIDFRKRWSGQADAVGESVGFFKIGPRDLTLLSDETLRRQMGAGRQDSYDDVLRVLVVADRFGCEDMSGEPWTELDFPHDLERAKREILPAILQESARAGNE